MADDLKPDDTKVPIKKIPTQPMSDDLKYNKGVSVGGDYAAFPKAMAGAIPRGRASLAKGGMVKFGSPRVTAPCNDTKSIKC